MKPLFMWAGGKSKMMKHYRPLMPKEIRGYSEPFFGGGAMFVEVMGRSLYLPEIVRINDINRDVMDIYRSVKDSVGEFEQVMDRLSAAYLPLDTDGRRKFFFDLRTENANDWTKWSPVEQSAVLYFLMKTAFNGIWQVNKNTNGRFGTPCGLLNQVDKVYDKENVREWNRALNSTEVIITSVDWKDVPVEDFTFYDPPYRDSFADYGKEFPDKKLEEIISLVEGGKGIWLCNRDSGDGFFDNRKAEIHRFPVTYTAGRRKKTDAGYEAKKATEILLLNR
jgi:DNA adenine methylase